MSLGTHLSFPKTLASRLTLWYAVIFTLSSVFVFLLFYILITLIVFDQTDQDLVEQAGRFGTILNSGSAEEVTSAMIIEAQAAGISKVFFRLLYPNGQAFFSSNMTYWREITVNPNAIKELLQGRDAVIETIIIPGKNKQRVRVLYTMLGPDTVIQIGESMKSYSRFLDAFKIIVFFTIVFLVMLASGVGWFMAKRAVSGIEMITDTARRISAGILGERVIVKKSGDEIDLLATTFNEMLDHIQILVREVKEVTDDIAHDLKSPITRIRGVAEVTFTTGRSIEEYQDMAGSIIEECDRLIHIIDTMLLISKTEAGVDKPLLEEIDLSALLGKTCEIFEPSAEDKGIMLQYHVQDEVLIHGDVGMLQRTFSNILDNAIKYTSSNGKIDVVLSRNNMGDAIISISDTGAGIAPDDIPHIFERFYRGDRSRSTFGTGLGLSLSRAIVRAHGGDITATSISGKGSIFTITLPVLEYSISKVKGVIRT